MTPAITGEVIAVAPASNWWVDYAMGMIAGIVGLLINLVPLPVLYGKSFLLGGALAMMIAIGRGAGPGALAAAIAAAPTIARWEHPYWLIFCVLHAGWIGIQTRRGQSPITAELRFLAFLGGPFLLVVFGSGLFGLASTSVGTVVLKYSLNALIDLLNASALLTIGRMRRLVRRRGSDGPSETLRDRLLYGFIFVAVAPALMTAVIDLRVRERTLHEGAAADLKHAAREAGQHVDEHLRLHESALFALARSMEIDGDARVRLASPRIDATREAFSGFRSMIVADSAGRLTAVSAEQPLTAEQARVTSVSDRLYFQVPMRTGVAYVSDVFRGRAFGHVPVVAVSAPVRDSAGNIIAIVQGSLHLLPFIHAADALPSGTHVIIADRAGTILYATNATKYRALEPVSATDLGKAHRARTRFEYLGARTTLTRSEAMLVHFATTSYGFQIFVERPIREIVAAADRGRRVLMLGAVAAIVISVLVALAIAQTVTKPLETLVTWARAFDARRDVLPPSAPSDAPREIHQLIGDFSVLTQRLRRSYTDLERSIFERDTLNTQLNEVMHGLDATIAMRTAELQAAVTRLEEVSLSKSRFLANMSHELRTPLNSVIGFANVLLKNKSGTMVPAELEYLQRVRDNGLHLLTLINDILDIAKVESGRMALEIEPVDVVELVRRTIRELEAQVVGRPIKLYVETGVSAAMVDTDGSRLRQVLINLVGNAIKFTKAGSVTVRLSVDDRMGRIRSLAVIDTGIGIPAGRLEAIFEPFEQGDTGTARRFGGTGLGLAICRSLCGLLNARLSVASVVGQGSTFTVTFEGTEQRLARSA